MTAVIQAGWLIYKSIGECMETGEVYEFANVVPPFGPDHVLAPDCWCHPEVDDDLVVSHNVMH